MTRSRCAPGADEPVEIGHRSGTVGRFHLNCHDRVDVVHAVAGQIRSAPEITRLNGNAVPRGVAHLAPERVVFAGDGLAVGIGRRFDETEARIISACLDVVRCVGDPFGIAVVRKRSRAGLASGNVAIRIMVLTTATELRLPLLS